MKHIVVLLFVGILGIATTLFLVYKPDPSSDVLSAEDTVASPSQSFLSLFQNAEEPPPSALTLEKIFDNQIQSTSTPDHVRIIVATGDVLLARSVNAKTVSRNDFTWPFHKTYQKLRDSDITIVNLETPLLEPCQITTDGMSFCGDRRNIAGLEFAGIDVVNIANNHIGNYGDEGVKQTIETIQDVGMYVSGTPDISVVDVRGMKVAFVGFNTIFPDTHGTLWANDITVADTIRRASESADIVIASFHWGIEYTRQPSDEQKRLGRLAIDSGADLVIGHHPHWWQPVEIYKGKLITYSHGNFVFDQEWSAETKEGIVGKYYFYDDQLIDAEFFPVRIQEYGQPYFLGGEEKEKVIGEFLQEM